MKRIADDDFVSIPGNNTTVEEGAVEQRIENESLKSITTIGRLVHNQHTHTHTYQGQ